MKKVRIANLEKKAPQRPAGYLEAFRKLAFREADGFLHLRDDDYERLAAKYRPARGLGDVVEKAIDKVTAGKGKKIAQKIARAAGKRDCGCGRRRDKLNKWVPFNGRKNSDIPKR